MVSEAMDKEYKVFSSEKRLYGSDPITNHRARGGNVPVYARLFRSDDWDTTHLFPLLATGEIGRAHV